MTQPKAHVLDSKTQQFLDAVAAQGGRVPVHTQSPSDARKSFEETQAGALPSHPARIEDGAFPVGPTGEVSVTIYRPADAIGPLPMAMYFHGGGWVLGSNQTHHRLLCDLVHATQAAFVFVNYALSPEVRFPVANEQAYAATKYVAEHGSELGLDGSRLAIVGDSVGGNMVAAVSLLAKERGGPRIAYQALCYPVTDFRMNQDSYAEYAEGPWLTKRAMEWFWDHYAPSQPDRANILAAPLLATASQLRGLPPALIIVAEHDCLRDEGEEYARRLSLAGIEVTAVRYLSTFHGFMALNGLADTPAVKSAIELTSQKLRVAFGLHSPKTD